jgi:hypothetical protein
VDFRSRVLFLRGSAFKPPGITEPMTKPIPTSIGVLRRSPSRPHSWQSGFGALQFFGSSVDVATPDRSLELALWFAKLLGQ